MADIQYRERKTDGRNGTKEMPAMSYSYMIDFGDRSDGSGAIQKTIRPLETLIPEQHDHLFGYIGMEKVIEDINRKTDRYLAAKGSSAKAVSEITAAIKKIHPYFDEFPWEADFVFNRTIAKKISGMDMDADSRSALFATKSIECHDGMDTEAWLDGGRHADGPDLERLGLSVRNARLFVTFILDADNPDLADIPGDIRYSMYLLSASDNKDLDMLTTYSMVQSASIKALSPLLDIDEPFRRRLVGGVHDMAEGNGFNDDWKSIVDRIRDSSKYETVITYHLSSFEDMIRFELFSMAGDGIKVKRCRKCHRLFPVYHDGQKYCDFRKEGELSCYRQSLSKQNAHDISIAYKRAYQTHYARVKSGIETEEDLRHWMDEAKSVKDEYLARGLTVDDYDRWLKKDLLTPGKKPGRRPGNDGK